MFLQETVFFYADMGTRSYCALGRLDRTHTNRPQWLSATTTIIILTGLLAGDYHAEEFSWHGSHTAAPKSILKRVQSRDAMCVICGAPA